MQEGVTQHAAHCKADKDAEGCVAQQRGGGRTAAATGLTLQEEEEDHERNKADEL